VANILPYDPERPVRLGPASNGAGTGYGDAYPEPVTPSKGLRDYLAILRRQWWIFLGITLVVTGVTVYRVNKLPTRYQAASTVRLADRRDAVVAGDPSPQQRSLIGRDTDPLASQIQLLMSRTVALQAVEMEGLRLKPPARQAFPDEIDSVKVATDAIADSVKLTFGPASVVATSGGSRAEALYGQPLSVEGVTLTVEKRPQVSQIALRVLPIESAAGEAVGGLGAMPRLKTDIVDLTYVGNDPYQAERMVNAMAEAFVAYSTLNAQQISTRRRVFLENQLRQTEAQLNGATGAFTNYRSGQRVFSSKTQGSAQEAGLLDIDLKRSQMAAEKKSYESLLDRALRSPEETQSILRVLISSPGMASNLVVVRSYAQLNMAEQARDSLLTGGAANTNPDVIAIGTRIAAATRQLLAAARSQIQSLDAQLTALDNLRAAGQTKIAAAPAAEAAEEQLAQQVKSVQTVADQLQAELQKAKMAEAVAAGQVEIVDLANHPGFPISNGIPRKIAMGILLGLLLGAGASVVVDNMNTSIRKRTDIERILQVPILAVIPRFVQRGGGAKARFALPSRAGKSRGRPGKRRPSLVTLADSGSPGAEAYRTLRTNLMFSQAVQALRTVVVTSASPGEGKTTTVGNLGIAFAQQNMRVLLLDCDLRRSHLHAAFDLSKGPGLTELLLGQVDQDDVVKPTTMPGLYVLPAGTAPPNPSEMLGGQKMRTTLQSLSEAFDLIILDTPPILAASDAAILATLSDGVIMVLRAGATESEAAQQAMHQLKAVGARIVGAVLNDPDAKVPLYGTHYAYDYSRAGT
jgi:tyrosine-protein kinase Etk/Wzc